MHDNDLDEWMDLVKLIDFVEWMDVEWADVENATPSPGHNPEDVENATPPSGHDPEDVQ